MLCFRQSDNEGIRRFFEGDDSYIPSSELSYLHVHPLLRPNFVTDVTDKVEVIGRKLIDSKVSGKPVSDLSNIAIAIGTSLSEGALSTESAEKICFLLRDLDRLCDELDTQLSTLGIQGVHSD